MKSSCKEGIKRAPDCVANHAWVMSIAMKTERKKRDPGAPLVAWDHQLTDRNPDLSAHDVPGMRKHVSDEIRYSLANRSYEFAFAHDIDNMFKLVM